jgi:hypothetical protein
MKKLLLVTVFCQLISFCASSQVVYLADTAFTTDIGYNGAPASCRYNGGYWLGLDMTHDFAWSLADYFTVPTGASWSFDTVILFGYQIGSSVSSPFTAAYLRIYKDGSPGIGGIPVWGDTVTNILATTGFTGIYRVDTDASSGSLTSTDRPIMYLKLYLSPAPQLSAGTYWLQWSVSASGSGYGNCPPKVLPGRINPAGQDGMADTAGSWSTIFDNGNTVGFNKIIKASAAIAASVPALNLPTTSLGQNAPNPFSGSTTMSFYMSQTGYARLAVYNTMGQIVATLIDGNTDAGEHELTFYADNLAPGIYYYQLYTNTGTDNKTMLLIK